MSKLKFNDVPFVPCNDCRHFQDCTDEAYRKGREEAIEEVYNIVTDFLIKGNTELDFNLALQNKILDLKYEKNS